MFQVNPLAEDSHEKNQALFSSKDKSKKLKCCLLQFLLGALTVVVVLLFYVHGKHLRSCRDGALRVKLMQQASFPKIFYTVFY